MTKTPRTKLLIEQQRMQLDTMLTGSGTVKRLNNLNWLRHEISDTEPRALFFVPTKHQQNYLDFSCMTNLGKAYDYIIENPKEPIDANAICKIHSILCANTNIHGAAYRTTPKVLEITVNGQRMHAPDAYEIPSIMNQIIFNMNNSSDCTITRAFNIHYDLIALQPFDDFNKRTARLIMNWILIQGGYRPILFNKPSDKQKYKQAIAARANGDIKTYTAYMSACMIRTQRTIIKVLSQSKVL